MRHPLMTAATLAIAVSLAGCGGDNGTASAPSSSTPAVTATTVATATPSATAASTSASASESASASASATPTQTATSSKPQGGTTIVAKAAGGKVTTASKRVKVKRGDTVHITVTSDVSDEIHVHTYDHKLFLQAGKPGTLTFKADIAGVIEVELEKSKLALVELQVG